MKKLIMFSLLMFAVTLLSSRAEAQFSKYTRTAQFMCNVSTITPTLCVDLSSAPYSGNVFCSFVLYGDTTTVSSTIRVDSASDTISTDGVPITNDAIRWYSFDQSQLVYKGQIWAITQGTTTTKLLIGIGRPDY